MHCSDFENRLNDLLDRRMSPDDDAALCAHAGGCRACAEAMAAYVSLTSAILELPRQPDGELPGESFPFAVMNRFDEQRSVSASRRRRQWLVAALATAAAVLIAVTLWRGDVATDLAGGAGDITAEADLPGYQRLAAETQQLASLFATRQLEVMNDLAEGIRPVATSFGAAYDAVLRTLPAGNAEATATSG